MTIHFNFCGLPYGFEYLNIHARVCKLNTQACTLQCMHIHSESSVQWIPGWSRFWFARTYNFCIHIDTINKNLSIYDTLQTTQNFLCTMNIIETSSERLLKKILNLEGNALSFINPAFHNLPDVMCLVCDVSVNWVWQQVW